MPQKVARADGEAGLTLDAYRRGPLGAFLDGGEPIDLSAAPDRLPAPASQRLLFAPWLLQDIGDYRGALQRWFAALAVGGRLIITVPHAFLYERQDALPSRLRPEQRRLYTPRALAEEIEEALEPNTYRLRWLGDLDEEYDYAADHPTGWHDVAAVIERIAAPAWGLASDPPARPAPVDLFEPDHVRVERSVHTPAERVLVLKLDHLGDFIMAIPALERLRKAFPAAEITLIVASWNEKLARATGIADHVLVFDAFPRSTSEEPIDLVGKTALLEALLPREYDVAIDFRTEPDTRFLLQHVRAGLTAGIGRKAQFPHLDIFLPVEAGHGRFDSAWSRDLTLDSFSMQEGFSRSRFSIAVEGARARPGQGALIWGPYIALPPGDYLFEPYLEVAETGLIACDVALDVERVAYSVYPAAGGAELGFRNERDGGVAEFRIWAVGEEPVADFRFYGGRLTKRGRPSTLHQAESLMLLVDLVALRLRETGVLQDRPL